MKKIFTLFLFVALASAVTAQKVVNDLNAEKRTVTGFHGVHVSTGIELILTKGSVEEVAVSAAKVEHRDKIVTKVENGILHIRYETKTGSINKGKESKDLKAYVSYLSLDQLTVTTGAEVEIDGTLEASDLTLTATTGGLVNGKISATKLKVNQDTGSKITLSGKADEFEIDGDTGSKFMGEELNTVNSDISVSTGAKVWITTEKELKAKATTGAMVKYKGTASVKDIKSGTGGTVSKIK